MTEYLPPSPCWLLWDKGFSEDVTFAQFEMAWTSFKSSAKKFDRHPFQKNRFHPTQKPIELYKWILKRYAKEGDKILDTHLGSGTNRMASWDLKLDFYSCELDAIYYSKQEEMFKKHKSIRKLF